MTAASATGKLTIGKTFGTVMPNSSSTNATSARKRRYPRSEPRAHPAVANHHGLGAEHAADLPGAGAEAAQDPHLPDAFDEGEGQRAHQSDQGDADDEQAEYLDQGDDGVVPRRGRTPCAG
nr:hypothetical protein [Trebonia sp.]